MSFGPLVIGLLLARLVVAAGTARAGRTTTAPGPRIGDRASQVIRFAIVWLVLAPTFGWLALAEPRAPETYAPGTIFLITVLLWPLALQVLAPLGLVRPAYYVGFAAWKNTDRSGAGLIAASRALHRKRDFDAEAAAWIEDKIQEQTSLRAGAIVAAACIAAARGDRNGARVLFESVRTLDPRASSTAATRVAAEWLAADAAARGAWEEVITIGATLVGSSRSAWLLAGVAKRLLGKPDAPGRSALLARWLFAPGRRHTFAIVERALSVPDGAAPEDDADDAAPLPPIAEGGDLLARALAAHARLLAAKKPTPRDVAQVGRAFDAAFEEDALGARIDERGALLGAMRAGEVLGRFRRDVEDSLFQLLKSHRIALDDTVDDLGEVSGRAQRRLRDETLSVIEALSDAVRNRVSERRALSVIDEWREWTALRMAYERGVLLGGPELRYLAFTKVHSDVCALAVWLFNDRKERPLANAMFRFLLAEATAVGDTEGIALQSKNVACGV